MNQGNHFNENSKPRVRTSKAAVLIIAVLLLLGAAVGSTVAFLTTQTKPVENSFEYAKVSCEVTGSKENVQIKNTGNTAAYIRATYVVTWRDAKGNIVPTPDQNLYAYELTENPTKNWVQGKGGYFYYPTPVAPVQKTDGSLLTCKVTKQPAEPEYFLYVEVIAESIQSEPIDAIQEAWGITPPNWN